MESEKSVFYVGIGKPIELRRQILECSRDILRSLQRYEKVKTIREKKVEYTMILKDMMADIKKLSSQLKLEFPKTNIMPAPAEPAKRSRRAPKKQPESMQELEDELSMIEAKLDNLSQ